MKTFPCYLCNTMTIIEYKDCIFWESGKKYNIPKVKHYVCPECGETYYDTETSKMLDEEFEKRRNNL